MVSYRPDNILLAFNLGVSLIPRTDTLVYLGVTFKFKSNLTDDISERCKKFISSVCGVLRHKGDGYEDVFSNILVKKCLPILNYALKGIYLDSASLNTVSKSWNIAFRWLFNKAKNELTRLLFLSYNTMPMRFLLDANVMYFVRNMLESPHMLLRNLCRFAMLTNELKTIFSKYRLILFSGIDIIKRSVNNAFFLLCNEQ